MAKENLMTKQDLIDGVAEETGLSKKKTGEVLAAVTAQIEEAVMAGKKLTLAGFAVFQLKQRAARSGRNPQTGDSIAIPAKQRPVARLTFGKDAS